MSVSTLFYVMMAKVLFDERIFSVQKLALLFLLIGPSVICLPIIERKNILSPIVSFLFVLAATCLLAAKQLLIKYLISKGKRRFNLMVYLQFVDSVIWTIGALLFTILNDEIKEEYLLIGLVAGICRSGSNAI